jgi:lysophospholipase L1-like esterase
MVAWTRILLAVGLVALVADCSNPTAGDPPPPVGPLVVSCPANVTVSGASGTGQTVAYSSPTTTGGTPPVTTTCSPASGTTFPAGTTPVTCTARDALSRSAVCGFTVTLVSSHLAAMSFAAFGDSLTAGENSLEPPPPGYSANYQPTCGPATTAAVRHAAQARPSYIDLANSYPTQLLAMLNSRFAGEAFTMDNEGLPGETAEDGVSRLSPCVFMTDHPNVLLLLEGTNDLDGFGYTPTPAEEKTIVGYLKTDVANAVTAGVPFIFVSTILPVTDCSPESSNCHVGPSVNVDASVANANINQTNALIRASISGATIVDGNAALFAADPTLASLIEIDGLHATPAGYTVLAQAFMNAIVNHIPITSLHRVRR